MAKKYYVVWKGAKTGVFDNWPEVQQLTSGRADAQYMGFPTKQEAEEAFKAPYSKALARRSLSKSPQSKSTTVTPQYGNKVNADVQIFSDGACSPNPGKSGTGIAVYQQTKLTELWYGLYDANGTNNTAELLGILESLKMAKLYLAKQKSVEILSDSKYSIDSVTQWAAGWQRRGWKKANGEEIKNPDIIKASYELYLSMKSQITITYVKGHANIEGNELADRMAVYARMQQETSFKQFTSTINIKEILAMPSG